MGTRTESFLSLLARLGRWRPGKNAEPLAAVPRRRRIVTACTLGFLGTNFFMFLRFFFPRTLFEPKDRLSESATRRTTDMGWTQNSRRTIGSGLSAMQKDCL